MDLCFFKLFWHLTFFIHSSIRFYLQGYKSICNNICLLITFMKALHSTPVVLRFAKQLLPWLQSLVLSTWCIEASINITVMPNALKVFSRCVVETVYKVAVIIQHSNSHINTFLAFSICCSRFGSCHPSCKRWFLWYNQINHSISIPDGF